jgi:signal transduction histidine kinase
MSNRAAAHAVSARPDAAPVTDGLCLESVFDAVRHGLWIQTGDRVVVNDAGRRLLGLGADEPPPPLSTFQLRHLDGTPLASEELAALPADHPAGPLAFRYRLRRLDGEDRVFAGSTGVVRDALGAAAGVVASFWDVTEDYNEAVLTKGFLEQLFALMPMGVVAADPETGELVALNQAFRALAGVGEDALGLRPPYPWAVSPDAVRDGQPAGRPAGWSAAEMRRADGVVVPVEVMRLGIEGEDGRLLAGVELYTDLTERRRFEQGMLRNSKLATLGELSAGVAHEINNPLFAILGLVEFLLADAAPGSKARERLLTIQETGLEIKAIVRALLDFARQRPGEATSVRLDELATHAVELVRRASSHKAFELVESLPAEPVTVAGSPDQLEQVFVNLIANAEQAMPDGGVVTVEVSQEGEWAVARVSDTGPGIADDVLPRVFDPFFTTKRPGGGSGLGLSMSLGIAQMHGGDLIAESAPGEGATLTLRLPLERA